MQFIQGYTPFNYQIDSVERLIQHTKRNGGCLATHQTGLGKTFIGASTAINLGETILVVSPKNNQRSWALMLPNATICTKASIPNKVFDVIIVDEAHNFTNVKNKSYQELVRAIYLQGVNKFPYVILMTATPLNNNITEFFNMVRLIPFRTSTPMFYLLPNLYAHAISVEKELKNKQRFKPNESFRDIAERVELEVELEVEFDGLLKKMGETLSLFSVRETRQSITNNYPNDIALMGSFPKINKHNVEYRLDKDIVRKTITLIENMPFAYYNYLNYVEKPQKSGFAGIMKCLLFKRLDSSICAFRDTINTILTTLSTIDFDGVTLKLKEGEVQVNSQFNTDNKKDIEILKEIVLLWLDYTDIEKINELKNIVRSAEGKVIIFTEYQETKNLIFDELSKEFKTIGFDSKSNDKTLEVIASNFDANTDKKENKYQILVTTDVLSEGVNLHEASTLIHFDTKWNPSRLTQREGRIDRIDRINKNGQTLQKNVYTFAVDNIVENIIKLEKKISHKKGISEMILSGEQFKFYPRLKPFLYFDKKFNGVGLNFPEGSIVFDCHLVFSRTMKIRSGDFNTNYILREKQNDYPLNKYLMKKGNFGVNGVHGYMKGIFEKFYGVEHKPFMDVICDNFTFMELLNISNIKHNGLVNIYGLVSGYFFANFYDGFPTHTEIGSAYSSNNDVRNNPTEKILESF